MQKRPATRERGDCKEKGIRESLAIPKAMPAELKRQRRQSDHSDSAAAATMESALVEAAKSGAAEQQQSPPQALHQSQSSAARQRGDRSGEYARQKFARNSEQRWKTFQAELFEEDVSALEIPEELFRSKENLDKITKRTAADAPWFLIPHPRIATSFELTEPLVQLLLDSAKASQECRKRGLKREAAEEETEAAEIGVKEEKDDEAAEEDEENEEAEDDKDDLIGKLRIENQHLQDDNRRLQDDNRRFVRRAHRLARLNRRYVDWSLQGINGF